MKRLNKIAIIGVGLIGGSIGLAVKKRKLAKEVVGIFRRRSTLNKAIKSGAIDHGTLDISKGVAGADLVIVATPVSKIPPMVTRAALFMKKGSVITDAGSVKSYIVESVSRSLPPSIGFVGSHPMAGSERAGVDNAEANLFTGAMTIITRTRRTQPKVLEFVSDFWRALGSRIAIVSPEEHDRAIALISHVPHIAAQSLCRIADKGALRFAASGFKDTTRVASSEPDLWVDIFKTNRKEIIKGVEKLAEDLKQFKSALEKNDYSKLLAKSRSAKSTRDALVE